MKKLSFILISLIILSSVSEAQRWKKERLSVFFGTGTNHFMGDLGGGGKDAAHFLGIRDIDFYATRPTFQAGIRYRILEELAVKPMITYAFLRGDDANSDNLARQARNLNFYSHTWEFGAQLEYYFIKEKDAARYTFSSVRGINKIGVYLILGGGGLYYNPYGQYGDEWIELRPLNTEGQGQDSYTYKGEEITPDSPYGSFAGFFSAGLGLKYTINLRWSIGLELTNRYTTTDYLDDAHDRYYAGAHAVADKHLNRHYVDGQIVIDNGEAPNYPTGTLMRGDPTYKDAYILTVITGYYKLNSTMKSRPKWIN